MFVCVLSKHKSHVCLLKLLTGILLQQDVNVDLEVKLFSNYGNEKIRVKEGNCSHLSGASCFFCLSFFYLYSTTVIFNVIF